MAKKSKATEESVVETNADEASPEHIGAACAAAAAAWDRPNINARQMLLSIGFWTEIVRAMKSGKPPEMEEPEAPEEPVAEEVKAEDA